MTWAVHNLHAPSVLLVDGGYTHDGTAIIKAGPPIHEVESFEEAEAWRVARLGEVRGA
jgi:hypothetical protein